MKIVYCEIIDDIPEIKRIKYKYPDFEGRYTFS